MFDMPIGIILIKALLYLCYAIDFRNAVFYEFRFRYSKVGISFCRSADIILSVV